MNFEELRKLKNLYAEVEAIISRLEDPRKDYIKAKDYLGDDYSDFRHWAIQNKYLDVDYNPEISGYLMTKSNSDGIYIESNDLGDKFFMVHKDIIRRYKQSKISILD